MKKNTVVYTAISGNYDDLKNPQVINKNFDYVCFTDNPKIKSDIWKIVKFTSEGLDQVRKCREVKILPHKYFSDYKYSIWIDGNIDIIDDVNELITEFIILKKSNLLTFKHPLRECIYEEAQTCINDKRDKKKIIIKQMIKYQEEKLPEQIGLIESNVIIRNHNNAAVVKLMENWWEEVREHSKRDQLSFNYCVWKNNFVYCTLKGNSRNGNPYFKLRMHKKSTYKKFKGMIKKILSKLNLYRNKENVF